MNTSLMAQALSRARGRRASVDVLGLLLLLLWPALLLILAQKSGYDIGGTLGDVWAATGAHVSALEHVRSFLASALSQFRAIADGVAQLRQMLDDAVHMGFLTDMGA